MKQKERLETIESLEQRVVFLTELLEETCSKLQELRGANSWNYRVGNGKTKVQCTSLLHAIDIKPANKDVTIYFGNIEVMVYQSEDPKSSACVKGRCWWFVSEAMQRKYEPELKKRNIKVW